MTASSSPSFTDATLTDFFLLSSEMMSIVNSDGRFSLVNTAFEQALGIPRNAFENTSFFTYVHPDEADFVIETIKRARLQGKPESFACRFVCADDTYEWLLWRIYPKSSDLLLAVASQDSVDWQKEGSSARLLSPQRQLLKNDEPTNTILPQFGMPCERSGGWR